MIFIYYFFLSRIQMMRHSRYIFSRYSNHGFMDRLVLVRGSLYQTALDFLFQRRLAIDKNAAKMRRLFCSVGYKNPNLQWLHDQLTQILPWYLLAPYLDILGSLRSKIPELMNYSLEPLLSKGDTKVARALAVVSRKPWDPINSSSLNILKQKLSHATQPIIFTVPTRTVLPKPAPQMKRMRFWNTQLRIV